MDKLNVEVNFSEYLKQWILICALFFGCYNSICKSGSIYGYCFEWQCWCHLDERIVYNNLLGFVKNINKMKPVKVKEKAEVPKLSCINLDYLRKRTKSNPVLMNEMISLYLEQTPPMVIRMTESLKKKEWTLLSATLHKMIPSFSIMGISADFENMARRVMELADGQQQIETIAELVVHLESVCKQACIELEQEYMTIKKSM